MAGNPVCCLTPGEWAARFGQWIAHGAPEDLLKASIYFDLRPLVGRTEGGRALRARLVADSARNPRFIKQMADNALRNRAPLNWVGGIETETIDGRECVDLKMRGTALFVDAARLYALARGIDALSTRERLLAAARVLGVQAHEGEAWVAAFEFLQMLRLRVQLSAAGAAAAQANPNLAVLDTLNDIDRRVLKESFRVARALQQRVQLDYQR